MRTGESTWTCDVKFPGCLGNGGAAWICQVEQIQCDACRNCRAAWSKMVLERPELAVRCPKCVPTAKPGQYRPPRPTEPLRGIYAEEIRKAMHKAGVLVDVQNRVLVILAVNAPFMNWTDDDSDAVHLNAESLLNSDVVVADKSDEGGSSTGTRALSAPAEAGSPGPGRSRSRARAARQNSGV